MRKQPSMPVRPRTDVRRLVILAALLAASCSARMGSIGAMLGKDHATGQLIVREVPPDMASARAGLKPDDKILLINGQDARRMTAEQVHEALVGPIGTKVALTVERDGRIIRVEVQRGPLRD